jgi:hypothetical protein
MNADAELDALVGRDVGVALDHRPLDFDGAVHRINNAPELDNCAVARALDDPAMTHGDGRVDQVASERPQPRRSSSAPVSRENPTTSDTKIAASFRVSLTALLPKAHLSQMAWP